MIVDLSQNELDLLKEALVSWTDGFSNYRFKHDEAKAIAWLLFTKLGGDNDFIFRILGR